MWDIKANSLDMYDGGNWTLTIFRTVIWLKWWKVRLFWPKSARIRPFGFENREIIVLSVLFNVCFHKSRVVFMIYRGWLFVVTEFFLYITNNSIIVHSRVNQATTLNQGGWVGLLFHPVCTLVGAISVRNSRGGWAGGHNFVAGLPFPDFLRVNFFVYFFNVCRSGIFKVVIIPFLNLWKVTPIIQTAETCLLNSKKISLRCERVNIPCTIWWSFRLFRWCNLAPRSSVAKAE